MSSSTTFWFHAACPFKGELAECAFPLEYVIGRPGREPFAYAATGTPPNWALPPGTEPRYTLYRTKDTSEPIVVLVAQGEVFRVLTPDHQLLAELRLPPAEQRWRPVREIARPKQPLLRARGASISSIIKSVLCIPLIFIEFICYLFTEGDVVIDPPTRTVWKTTQGLWKRTALKQKIGEPWYRVYGKHLDHRIAYAQSVAGLWRPDRGDDG
ncbi:hypothetical protein YWIDRAFT_01970 [Streptomyces sp. SceaMP-e96]|uniref:hypothetical protein n=1 Tax=Streptomyces TaxID=1883 RepID=UPI000823A5BC|nr:MULTISPECIES: hypothetical protein [unclassified Streptomyces]MYT12692.1 hypothetical protein [Streptomyces sp. SID4951]SCK38029.1 hypothetical protein YWIDRAFT_01970 [Streptomyces sp. SceaMP-e96]